MKAILGIVFAVIFGLIGARFAGWFSTYLVGEGFKRFSSPDQVANFMLMANISVALAAALIGAVIGVLLAARLRHRVIRKEL